MKGTWLFTALFLASIGTADGAVRDANSINRANTPTQTVVSRAKPQSEKGTTSRGNTSRATVSRPTTPRNATRTATQSRTQTARTATLRSTTNTTRPSRATNNRPSVTTARTARNAVQKTVEANSNFGSDYNTCRDAYFTCMDQFCATQNDTYRRCVCSTRITEIEDREHLLSQTADQLQDFVDFNISVIPKTADEVKAMITASQGEAIASYTKDTTAAGKQLKNIGDVLASTKKKSLSTAGTLDIAGDINQIWANTELASGVNIANLVGEPLYNAVHAQCSDMVRETCQSQSILNMVVSAYGMYIENDCTTLATGLDKNITNAKGTVRETERQMHQARLENYNAHNSTNINDCVAMVRTDLTADTACGPDFVHCLDVSGRYLNRITGAPIYSPEFYQLEYSTSLSGDLLTNKTNRLLVAELNRMRSFAENSMKTCQDLSDQVWDEFVRQTIVEIHQQQQQRIRLVKDECLDVVTSCYDEQTQSLRDFTNVKDQLLLGARLELSEQMCADKLNACSNLYGGGPVGFREMLIAMDNITDQKIGKNCRATLTEYAQDICAVPTTDTIHAYPFACRVYNPGSKEFASINDCNTILWSANISTNPITSANCYGPASSRPSKKQQYVCPVASTRYTDCAETYFMAIASNGQLCYDSTGPNFGNFCAKCPTGYTCAGGTSEPIPETSESETTTNTAIDCDDYPGSLYQKLVRYALQACVRPSAVTNDDTFTIPTDILEDVNSVMDSIRATMGKELAKECERLGGIWVSAEWVDKISNEDCSIKGYCTTAAVDGWHDITYQQLYKKFYEETGANTDWGFCADKIGMFDIEENQNTTGGEEPGGEEPGGEEPGGEEPTDEEPTEETT